MKFVEIDIKFIRSYS